MGCHHSNPWLPVVYVTPSSSSSGCSCYGDAVSRSGHVGGTTASTRTLSWNTKNSLRLCDSSSSSSSSDCTRRRRASWCPSVCHPWWHEAPPEPQSHYKTVWESHNGILFSLDIAFIRLIVQYCFGITMFLHLKGNHGSQRSPATERRPAKPPKQHFTLKL